MSPSRYALMCPRECSFTIALQGHDFEVINRGIEAYDECPNCGAELREAHVMEKNGRLIVSALKKQTKSDSTEGGIK